MGWGLTLRNVYLSRVTKAEIESEIDREENSIKNAEQRIFSLIGYTPKDADELQELFSEVTDVLDGLEESNVRLFLLRYAEDNPDMVE